MNGSAAIFAYLFRVQGEAGIPPTESRSPDGHRRYRAVPFAVAPVGRTLLAPPPLDIWPLFTWSDRCPAGERVAPPTGLTLRFFGDVSYDAMRVDAWGDGAEQETQRYAGDLISWIRHLTAQPWVGDAELYTEVPLRHTFAVDGAGGALASPYANARGVVPHAPARPLTAGIFAEACGAAASRQEPPLHWALWFDGQNHRARGATREAVMAFTLSLEVARNSFYPRFAATNNRPGLGAVLRAPFADTDLLNHLSGALESVVHRSLERERPDLWPDVKSLYVARHHVAHGRPPLVKRANGVAPVDDTQLIAWTKAVFETLKWIEALPSA